MEIYTEFILKVLSLVLLGYALRCAVKQVDVLLKNIVAFGSDNEGKRIATRRAQTSVYIAFALMLIFTIRIFGMISQDLFVALLTTGLAALGINAGGKVYKEAASEKSAEESKRDANRS